MKLLLISSVCLIGICLANTLRGGDIETFGIGTNCDLLVGTSGVICVTKTQFVLGYQNPSTDTPISCPVGTVCNDDLPEICSNAASPTCYNDVLGVAGVCNQCSSTAGVGNSPVCVNKTHYSFCAGGYLQLNMIYPCNNPTPNCKASFTDTTLTGICTNQATGLDCP